MAVFSARIVNHWVHSHEEDAGDVEVYRPAGYPFPMSRGRRGFDLAAGGQFSYDGLGPTDKSERLTGRWSSPGAGRIRLEFDAARRPPETLEIVSSDDNVLKIRRLHS